MMGMNRTSSKHIYIGIGSLLTVGVLFGLSGVMAKYLSGSLNPYQVVEYRFAIALFAVLLIAVLSRRRLQFGEHDKKTLALFALSFPASVILFTLAIFNTSVALAVFSFYIATLVSSFVIGRLYFGERVHRYKQIALALIVLAIFVFSNPFGEVALGIGFIYGLLSGVVQGIASGFQKKLSKSTDRISLLIVQTAVGAMLAAVILLFTREPMVVLLAPFDWLVVAIFGASMLAISYLFLVGFKYTNLNTGSILVSSELFFGPFFALLLLGEVLSLHVIIGGVLTIVAAVFANMPEPDRPRKV